MKLPNCPSCDCRATEWVKINSHVWCPACMTTYDVELLEAAAQRGVTNVIFESSPGTPS